MKITDLSENIFYIEDAFPEWKEFIEAIEANENNPDIHPVIPQWSDWYDSRPVKKKEDNDLLWEQDPDNFTKGKQKLFDWDITVSNKNSDWPKNNIDNTYSKAHEIAGPIIDLIHNRYLEVLKVWSEKTGNKLDFVSKNYFLRKYHKDGEIGPHIDKNDKNPMNTMDWTALIYLNDDYDGGELTFTELGITIKPTAGSVVFFPCTAVHEAKPVANGEKYYLFLVLHSEFGHGTGLVEPYHNINLAILRSRGITDHPLQTIDYGQLSEAMKNKY